MNGNDHWWKVEVFPKSCDVRAIIQLGFFTYKPVVKEYIFIVEKEKEKANEPV